MKDVELRCPETSGAVFSDNYFNLVPGQHKTIQRIDSAGTHYVEIKAVNSSLKRIKL